MKKADIILVVCLMMAIPTTAHAYIDPGSSSLFLQVVVAGGVGAVIMFRRLIGNILRSFISIFKPKE